MTATSASKDQSAPAPDPKKCGVVMPISTCDGCSEQHWGEVKLIIFDAVEACGFVPSLVSDADDVGIIQKRIIQNLYENPIVVCDVSGKNPNVMFELGVRLAFDKPTIIVKDDKTTYSFDTAPIEHLEYPRDLRFGKIVDFKKALTEKVKATHRRATEDSNYTTFLKHFGKFTVAKLETSEVSKDDFILEEIKELRHLISRREMSDRESFFDRKGMPRVRGYILTPDAQLTVREAVEEYCSKHPEARSVERLVRVPGIMTTVADVLVACGAAQITSDDIENVLKLAVGSLKDRWKSPIP